MSLRHISVEPALFLHALGGSLFGPVYAQLIERGICRDMFPPHVCAHLHYYRKAEAQVHGEWAMWMWYVHAVGTPAVVLFSLFVSPWSDRFGRKWMMLSAPAFAVVASLQFLANAYWPDLPTWQLLLVTLPLTISGGQAGMATACMAYAADISDRGAGRSVRLAVQGASLAIGGTMGEFLGSTLYRRVGPMGNGIGFTACSILTVLYIAVFLRESVGDVEVEGRVRGLFKFASVKRMWEALWREREGASRRLLHMYIVALTLTIVAGGASAGLPFLEGPPISWTLPHIMIVGGIMGLYSIFCHLVLFPLVKLKLHIADGTLLVVSHSAAIVGHILLFNARSGLYVYASLVLAILQYGGIAQRALLSRIVDDDEQGCVFGAITIIENVVPLGSTYVFARFFQATAFSFPTLIFGVGGALLLIPLALYALTDLIDRRAGMSETK